MEERFYREQEIVRLPGFLPAATYNLAHTLLARAGTCLFVPIRSMQYMAVLDAEEFIFVDSLNKAWVELAWQHFRPQTRTSLDEPDAPHAARPNQSGRHGNDANRPRRRPVPSGRVLRFACAETCLTTPRNSYPCTIFESGRAGPVLAPALSVTTKRNSP